MIGFVLKAASVGFILYGLTLSARSGLNKATVRRRRNNDEGIAGA